MSTGDFGAGKETDLALFGAKERLAGILIGRKTFPIGQRHFGSAIAITRPALTIVSSFVAPAHSSSGSPF